MKKSPHYCWVILFGTCIMMSVGFGMCLNAVGVFLPFVAESIGVSKGQVSYYMTIQGFGMMAGMYAAGKLIGRVSIKLLLSAATCIMAACFVVLSFGSRLWHWYVIAIPLGFAVSFIAPLPISVLISNWFEKKRGFASGVAFAFSGIMGSVLSPVATEIILAYGWPAAYRFYAVVALVCMLPTAMFLVVLKPEEKGMLPYGVDLGSAKELQEEQYSYGVPIGQAKKMPVFYITIAIAGMLSIAGGFNQQFPSFAVSTQLSAQVGSYLVTTCMAMQLIANVPLGMLCDRFGVCCSATLYSAVGGAGAFLMAFGRSLPLYYLGCAMYGVGVCQTMVISPQVAREIFGKRDYGKVNAMVMISFALLGSFSHTVYAGLAELLGSYRPSLFLAGIFYMISIALVNIAYLSGRRLVVQNKEAEQLLTGEKQVHPHSA